MATEITIRPGQTTAKIRSPWAVLGLTLVTLGIYSLFWWYFINREMRDLGEARGRDGLGTQPAVSVLALFAGALVVIPTIWTYVTTCKRIQKAQAAVGAEKMLSGWIVLLLAVLTLGIGVNLYMQFQLNSAWESPELGRDPDEAVLGGSFRPPMAGLEG